MRGDKAPDMVVAGCEAAQERHPAVQFVLFGDEARISPLVAQTRHLKKSVRLVHTDEFVSGDAKPAVALRSGRKSSMRLAIDAVRDGEAAGIVSAGNTGALMAMAKFVLKTLPGIDRPAIASLFPTTRGESVMLDLGANVQCDTNNLVQFRDHGRGCARCSRAAERGAAQCRRRR